MTPPRKDPVYVKLNAMEKRQEAQGKVIGSLKQSVDKILAALLGDEFNNNQGLIKTQADHETRIKKIEIDKILVIKISALVSTCFGILYSMVFLTISLFKFFK